MRESRTSQEVGPGKEGCCEVLQGDRFVTSDSAEE